MGKEMKYNFLDGGHGEAHSPHPSVHLAIKIDVADKTPCHMQKPVPPRLTLLKHREGIQGPCPTFRNNKNISSASVIEGVALLIPFMIAKAACTGLEQPIATANPFPEPPGTIPRVICTRKSDISRYFLGEANKEYAQR